MAYSFSAFKAYDVRGAYGEIIDEHLCAVLGYGLADWLLEQTSDPVIMLASDVRLPNTSLIRSFLRGVHTRGIVRVEFASFCDDHIHQSDFPFGVCSTPMAYALAQGKYPLSVVFTASHNPAEDVGMKFFDEKTTFLSQQFLQHVFTTYESKLPSLVSEESVLSLPLLAPGLEDKKSDLFARLMLVFDRLESKHSFAIDFSNGAGTSLERQFLLLLQQKGHTIHLLNQTPDGTFPAHLSETIDAVNYRDLADAIQLHGLAFGVLFDGDVDRLGLIGPDGKMIGGDLLLAILTESILPQRVVYEVMCSQIVAERASAIGGEAVLTRMGRFFIKQKMDEVGAQLGGETSGHIMFGEVGGFEMPLLALAYVLLALEKAGSWESLMAKVRVYPKSPIMSFSVQDKQQFLTKVDDFFVGFKKETIDGISVFGDDFWLNVRPSNTENKIRATVEASTQEKVDEIVGVLKGFTL